MSSNPPTGVDGGLECLWFDCNHTSGAAGRSAPDLAIDLTGQSALPFAVSCPGTNQASRDSQPARARGARAVIVTLGSRGALILDDTGLNRFAAQAVQAVDTTGAGGAFVGSLAWFLARGDVLRVAAHKACLVATQSVLRSGTQTSFPYPH